MRTALCLTLLGGCATTGPVTEVTSRIAAADWKLDWFSDGPPIVITARNRSDEWKRIKVVCAGDDVIPAWPVWVAPHSEVRVLGQVMNKYTHDACWEQK